MKERTQIFPKNSPKTYGLVEMVKGTSPMVDKGPDDAVLSFPVVFILELIVAMGTTLVLMIISMLKDAPLEEMANPVVTPAVAKAPWYFMGLQEMLEHMHPVLAGLAVPGTVILILILLPYIDNDPRGAGRWLETARQKKIVLGTFLWVLFAGIVIMTIEVMVEPRHLLEHVLNGLISNWVISPLYILFMMAVPLFGIKKKGWTWNRRELVLVLFTGLIATAIFLTIVGFFFRGPGFELFWPWAMPDGYNPLNNL
jgi:hypothetical protein